MKHEYKAGDVVFWEHLGTEGVGIVSCLNLDGYPVIGHGVSAYVLHPTYCTPVVEACMNDNTKFVKASKKVLKDAIALWHHCNVDGIDKYTKVFEYTVLDDMVLYKLTESGPATCSNLKEFVVEVERKTKEIPFCWNKDLKVVLKDCPSLDIIDWFVFDECPNRVFVLYESENGYKSAVMVHNDKNLLQLAPDE